MKMSTSNLDTVRQRDRKVLHTDQTVPRRHLQCRSSLEQGTEPPDGGQRQVVDYFENQNTGGPAWTYTDRPLQDSQTDAARKTTEHRGRTTVRCLYSSDTSSILQQASRTHRDRRACFDRPSMFSQRFKGFIRVFSQMSAACEVREK